MLTKVGQAVFACPCARLAGFFSHDLRLCGEILTPVSQLLQCAIDD